jgi:hypothetical protein
MTDGQIHPLNESGVQSSRETQSLQGDFEICLCPQAHHGRDSRQLAMPVAFLHLTVDQLRCRLPTFAPSALGDEPQASVQNEQSEHRSTNLNHRW